MRFHGRPLGNPGGKAEGQDSNEAARQPRVISLAATPAVLLAGMTCRYTCTPLTQIKPSRRVRATMAARKE
jgi:hypothetical protein